jgi:hypothetical protein
VNPPRDANANSQAADRDSPANQQLQLFRSLPEEKYGCACGCGSSSSSVSSVRFGMAGHLVHEERRYPRRAVTVTTRKLFARDEGALKEERRGSPRPRRSNAWPH